MQGASSTQASTAAGAVFLSYASQDAAAAKRICEGLIAGGVEVWFDQSELRGGDAWDHKIRNQIQDCRLFIPVISANTELRDEGYFRREWSLAVDRTRDMVHRKAFVVPVVIDGTSERGAAVPEKFLEVQWTRLVGGETPPAFVDRIKGLLTRDPSPGSPIASASLLEGRVVLPAAAGPSRAKMFTWIAASIAALVCAYFLADPTRLSHDPITHTPPSGSAEPQADTSTSTTTSFNPPPYSIAVLPFVNMSGEKDQDYFSQGLTEELLNSLAAINEMQVAARTSSFSFEGEHADIATVAHKLNVASVLEGSVRRSGHTIRVSAQLINAVTGFQLWSKNYDRELGDVLKLQTEIATAVATALKVTLIGDEATKIELGGTRNPAAFDAYLRASNAIQLSRDSAKDHPLAIEAYTEAIQLDPNFALAFAGRSSALTTYAAEAATGAEIGRDAERAVSDARRAIAIAPDLAQGHAALARIFMVGFLDLAGASVEYDRALTLAPGNAAILRECAMFFSYIGHFNAAIKAARRAVALDPLARISHTLLGHTLYYNRQYEEAITVYAQALSLNPNRPATLAAQGMTYYALGRYETARTPCEVNKENWLSLQCLAIVYVKLGREPDAQAALAKLQATVGDDAAYQIATIYSQWNDRAKALEWIDKAVRSRDPGLVLMKSDPLLDPLRSDPHFQKVLQKMRFPE